MGNRTVHIRERVKHANGKWKWQPVEIPANRKLKLSESSRKGRFYICWYEGRDKKEKPVDGKTLGEAVWEAKIKQRYLEDQADGLDRPDPIKPEKRITIPAAIKEFLAGMGKSEDTEKLYRQNLHEFADWTDRTYVNQIDKPHLMAFKKHLLEKHKGRATRNGKKGNAPLTADWKLTRIKRNRPIRSYTRLACSGVRNRPSD
jgi:hypothetical protein